MHSIKTLVACGAATLVAGASASMVVASAADASYLNGCNVPQVTLYAAADQAQGFGSAYCASNVGQMEVEVDLYEYWISTDSWHFEAARTAGPVSVGSGKNLSVGPAKADCNTSQQRDWKVTATGYGDINGTWYTDQKSMQETLDCRK